MIIKVSRAHAAAVLGAMLQIALAHGEPEVTDADRATIDAAARIVLGLEPVPDLAPCSPARLANLMLSQEDATQAVRMLAVMSLVDGRIDAEKTALVAEYARALRVDEAYLRVLAEAAQGEIAAATACMVRRNVASFPLIDPTGIDTDPVAPFLPYRDGHDDPELAARYAQLAHLPEGTFGRAFWEHFQRNGFAFPGEENGLVEGFTTPHDTSHVLSGYSTSQQGELCVSTFIGAMHPDHPMSAEVLPVLFSWHLGIKLNEIARSSTGAFEPRRFWTAWDRGAATTVDVLDPGWDFWAATPVPLEELRRAYAVPAVDPALLA
ncbi:MAG: hypothetical protein L0H84_14545 [Pseudonocardia sp.]|nr:hypothetical protein [Pseudonocardia sp.]